MRIALVIAGPYPAFRGSQVLVSHLAAGLQQQDDRDKPARAHITDTRCQGDVINVGTCR